MSIQTVQISLIGFMGAGKTSVGRVLAGKTGRQFTDTDERITAGAGISINEIFARYGEPYFRDLETEQLKKLRKETEPLVISAGGGLPLREENRKLLRQMGPVVFLEASEEELCRRLRGSSSRPMLQGGSLEERIRTLMEQRQEKYEDAATGRICTDGLSVTEVADEIIRITRI